MKGLVVNEIFHSIQGESTHAGRPCVFIRLTYCNLRCTYCDTAYAFNEGTAMSIPEILQTAEKYRCSLVEVTGGEPLFQEETPGLLKALCDAGYETLLETGGSLDISPVDPRVKRIVDFKCPGSGMEKKNLWSNVDHLTGADEVKFVIGSREDFDWSAMMREKYAIDGKCTVLMSPVHGEIPPADLARWILESGVHARMQLQMHKFIWEPTARGV